jgi:hypothetical protein
MHLLISGPTKSGKTTLAIKLVDLRDFVIVIGTKPKDEVLESLITHHGFKRVYSFPIPKKYLKPDENGQVKLLFWPKIQHRDDILRYKSQYQALMDWIYFEGGWTVVVDESIYVTAKTKLDLGEHISDLAFMGQSNDLTMIFIMQRPSGVPRITWSSISDAILFKMGITTDLTEMAALGSYTPRDVKVAIRNLREHQFLLLPTRAQSTWAVSEVVR